jgi:hypothetical protein
VYPAAGPYSAVEPPVSSFEDMKLKRQSRSFGFFKQKSKSQSDLPLKSRLSWFGGKPDSDEDVPAVPSLPAYLSTGHEEQFDLDDEEDTRPGTALTTDQPVSWSCSPSPAIQEKRRKRLSIFGKWKRSQSTASQSKRQSLFGGTNRSRQETAPPVPALPVNLSTHGVWTPVTNLEDRQGKRSRRGSLSRALSRARSKSDTTTTKNKRRSWIESSNPDEADDDLPPPLPAVPSLMYDRSSNFTPESSVETRSPENFEPADAVGIYEEDAVRMITRGNSIKQPRPVSGLNLSARRSYIPRNAANGFVMSTNARSSHRHSLLDDGEGGLIYLSEEQQREWDKLKFLMDEMDHKQDRAAVGSLAEFGGDQDRVEGAPHSNADALAALEFFNRRW